MAYSLDTSYLVDAWNIWYPFDSFTDAWRLWASVVIAGDIFALSIVRDETRRHALDLVKFLDAHAPNWAVDVDSDVALLNAMSSLETDLLRRGRGKPQSVRRYLETADPFVVLHAELYGHTVVSMEESAPNSRIPKIPDLCEARGVRHFYPNHVVAELGYSFAPSLVHTANRVDGPR